MVGNVYTADAYGTKGNVYIIWQILAITPKKAHLSRNSPNCTIKQNQS